jgi:cell division FtsZ-interacting protein ZapD
MAMMNLKLVGKSGQISLGKNLSGVGFVVEELPGGDLLLHRAKVVPDNEAWLHTPEMKAKLAAADAWMQVNLPQTTNVDFIDDLTKESGDADNKVSA